MRELASARHSATSRTTSRGCAFNIMRPITVSTTPWQPRAHRAHDGAVAQDQRRLGQTPRRT